MRQAGGARNNHASCSFSLPHSTDCMYGSYRMHKLGVYGHNSGSCRIYDLLIDSNVHDDFGDNFSPCASSHTSQPLLELIAKRVSFRCCCLGSARAQLDVLRAIVRRPAKLWGPQANISYLGRRFGIVCIFNPNPSHCALISCHHDGYLLHSQRVF